MKGSRDETSVSVVAGNVSLSKRNRDSSMQEGNRIKQGFEESSQHCSRAGPGSIYRTTKTIQSAVRRRKTKA
jgi:hypothetical protein